MSCRNHGEIVGRVLQLHRVTLFSLKIDHDLIEQKIPLRDAPKPPAFVQTKSAGLEFFQLLGSVRGQFSRFDKFLQFRVHPKSRTSYV